MASSELSRVAYVLVVFGMMVVVQLTDEVEAQGRIANRTDDSNDLDGRSGKVAMLPYRMVGAQRRKRTTMKAEEPFASYVDSSSSSIDQEKRARSSFRGDLGKRMLVLTDALSPEDDLSTRVTWLPGKRIKVNSRFRGDLGKRARSSFRGDLGKRQELRTQEQDQEEDQPEVPQTPFIDDDIHQLSPFLLSERDHDSRYRAGDGRSDKTERKDDYDGGDVSLGGMSARVASRRWHQSAPRWRSVRE